MAFLSDARTALVNAAAAALYPNGTSQPSAVGSTVTVEPGWPIPRQLDAIMAAGNAMISVYKWGNGGKNTTRFLGDDDSQAVIPAAQLTLTVSGNQVTVGGAINAGEAPALRVNYLSYSYAVQAADTVDSVAAALAAMIPNATVNGATITLTDVFDVEAAISVPVTIQEEIGRQTQVFMVIPWAPTPDLRDAISNVLELAFKRQPRIVMPDSTWARLLYHGVIENDGGQKQRIYRRTLLYEVEFALVDPTTSNTVTDFGVNVTPANGASFTVNI